MKIAFHGGQCCGVKTIHGFGMGASCVKEKLPPLKKKKFIKPDASGGYVDSRWNFFNEDAPYEPRIERLDRYLEFLDRVRPAGIVEVCLSAGEDPKTFWDQTQHWEEIR
jgi:hypothetical protein